MGSRHLRLERIGVDHRGADRGRRAPRRAGGSLILAVLALALATTVPARPAGSGTGSPGPREPAPLELPAPGGDGGWSACRRVAWIEVHKRERILRAWCEGGRSLDAPIVLGRAPRGRKQQSGDRRTPEGAYRIASPARASRFHVFLAIDYPSRADAAEALADGRIDPGTYLEILHAHLEGRLPPQRSPLGGHLGIHGRGERWADASPRLDWTDGCIALRDVDVEALAGRVAVGTPVFIHP